MMLSKIFLAAVFEACRMWPALPAPDYYGGSAPPGPYPPPGGLRGQEVPTDRNQERRGRQGTRLPSQQRPADALPLVRQCGLFAGSGVAEAGCKSVIGQRLKQSGMHWTVNGADSIIALRTAEASSQWEATGVTGTTRQVAA
jgi:hypothetical protein